MSKKDSYDLVIIRTSDGSKAVVATPLDVTLSKLKDLIHRSSLGPCFPSHQRLFHLGRELKTAGRSLESLNVGRFNNFILHLQAKPQPEVLEISASSPPQKKRAKTRGDDDDVVLANVVRPKQGAAVIDLLDDSEDEETNAASRKRAGRKRQRIR